MSITLKGIDISAYQPTVDFEKVKAAAIDIVYIKATEGTTYTNPYLKEHAAAAKAVGLKVGFYHFMTPQSKDNAIAQAKHFINAINGLSYDCKLALDLEKTGNMAKATINSVAKAFLDEIKARTGKTPVLYSYTAFIKSYLTSVLTCYPLWVADYKSGSPSTNGVWADWIGWQYSSTGSVSGMSGNVDMDIFENEILVNNNADYFAALNKLVADKVIVTVEYWQNAATNSADVNGEYMATVIEKMTSKNTLHDGVAALVSAGVVSSPAYWLANCMAGKTVKIDYVKALIINAVAKLKENEIMSLKLGKQPFKKDHRDLLYKTYRAAQLPIAPAVFTAHQTAISSWGMLGNDSVGDCTCAGADHETMLWTKEGSGGAVIFTDQNTISDYSAITGYTPTNPNTDQGAVVRDVLKYRKNTGMTDKNKKRHKIGAFLLIDHSSLNEVKESIYLFSAIGIGIKFPDSAMSQFNAGQPWTVTKGAHIEGGHYVPLVGYDAKYLYCITWGKLQPMDYNFFKTYCDEAWVILSQEYLNSQGKSPEGFNLTQLQADLNSISSLH